MAKDSKKVKKPEPEKSKRSYQQRTVKPESMEEGESIEGRLLDIQPGKLSSILCIAVEGHGIKRIWMSTVLENSISRLDVGKFVKIKYKGEEKTSSGREVKIFDVWVEDLD